MDYKGDNIGLRVDEAAKKFCVILKDGATWKQAGDMQKYPLPYTPTLATVKSSSDIAILMLGFQNPDAAQKFKTLAYPH